MSDLSPLWLAFFFGSPPLPRERALLDLSAGFVVLALGWRRGLGVGVVGLLGFLADEAAPGLLLERDGRRFSFLESLGGLAVGFLADDEASAPGLLLERLGVAGAARRLLDSSRVAPGLLLERDGRRSVCLAGVGVAAGRLDRSRLAAGSGLPALRSGRLDRSRVLAAWGLGLAVLGPAGAPAAVACSAGLPARLGVVLTVLTEAAVTSCDMECRNVPPHTHTDREKQNTRTAPVRAAWSLLPVPPAGMSHTQNALMQRDTTCNLLSSPAVTRDHRDRYHA